MIGEVDHRVLVHAAADDGVELDRAEACDCAAAIASSTRATGKPTSFIRPKVSSSSASRLTVTRWRPAAARALAGREERAVRGQCQVLDPLERRQAPDQAVEAAADERLAAGEADLADPQPDRRADDPVISSKARVSSRARKAWSGPNASRGMQYVQRKLHRSVTLTRRSRIGRSRVSSTVSGEGMAGDRTSGDQLAEPHQQAEPDRAVPPPTRATREASASQRGMMKPPRPRPMPSAPPSAGRLR